MTAFSVGVDVLFRDVNIGRDAVYQPDIGDPVNIRVIVKQPDIIVNQLPTKIQSETTLFDVRVSEIASFKKLRDKIIYAGDTFIVQNAERKDPDRLIWTVDCYKQ
jgi:hypothetical protein